MWGGREGWGVVLRLPNCCDVLCCVVLRCCVVAGVCLLLTNNTWIFQIHIQQGKKLYVWLDAD